jgi:lipopolysaccharide/colanic/teichoic acid biosynthesis glycosyltransferase
LDVTVAAAGLVILSPLLATIAVAIKLTSRGPVFYLGERVGRHGRSFKIYKFRTMVPNADRLGTTTAMADPRITRIGEPLRRYKLDELPQMINVLRGEMSLVGPRPEVKEHTSAYTEEERAILDVPPGITDYSSLQFFHLDQALGAEDAHAVFVHRIRAVKNQLRLQYVRNRSFRVDLHILWLTALRMLRALVGGGPNRA